MDGEILKNEGGILYVDDGDKVVEIPTEVIEDIDYPGETVAIAGGVMTLTGVSLMIKNSAWPPHHSTYPRLGNWA